MSAAPTPSFIRRLFEMREQMLSAGLDALIVTHPPNVRYLTGFRGSAGAVVVTRSRCVLVVDFRYVTAARELLDAREDDAVELRPAEGSLDDALVALLKRERVQRIGVEGAWMAVNRFNRLSVSLSSVPTGLVDTRSGYPSLVSTERIVERPRMIKDAGEIATLREAALRLSAVARTIGQLATPGRTELEVAADIDAALRRAGFERPAFETIVASGPNGALPHARPSDRRLRDGDGVVLDFGGVYDGYCVDLTRTIQLGAAGPAFRRIFDAVAAAHRAAIAAVRPGVRASAVDAAAREVLARHGLGDAFGHATGHGLGLEVHEEPRIGKAADGAPDMAIEPGMVFTIEPGAYVAGVGGVRIEDDVLVTAQGCELLTQVSVAPETGA